MMRHKRISHQEQDSGLDVALKVSKILMISVFATLPAKICRKASACPEKLYRHMIIMKINSLQKTRKPGKIIERKISFRRTVSLIIILISASLLSGALCLIGNFYPDEWICIFYIDIIFYLLLIFELEYERLRKQIANNTKQIFKTGNRILGNCILYRWFCISSGVLQTGNFCGYHNVFCR